MSTCHCSGVRFWLSCNIKLYEDHDCSLYYAESDSSGPAKEHPHVIGQHKELMASELPAQPSMGTASNISESVSNPKSAATAASTSKVPDSTQTTDALHEELLLLPNSASSNKARHGGSIYDMLVQEIKSLKLQQ